MLLPSGTRAETDDPHPMIRRTARGVEHRNIFTAALFLSPLSFERAKKEENNYMKKIQKKDSRPSRNNKNMDHGIPPNKYNPHAWILGKPTIGDGTWIGPFTLIDAKYANVTIGKGCNIATGSQILSHSTVHRCISEGAYDKVDFADVTIGDHCFIGANAVVLMGASIGHHSVIAAGCVVPEGTAIPPYSIVMGVPGKIVGNVKKRFKI
jgi:carbonic anhydrase/acetyltransferase-like protein (isoleucine patch superfamily)